MALTPSPFKDSRNRYLTRSLFVETKTDLCEPIFTLDSKEDYDGYISVYRLYMEADDPTEYTVAMRMLGDLEHWKLLCDRDFFSPYVALWRDELQAKIRSEAVGVVRATAVSGTPSSLPAARWLAENDLLNTTQPPKKERGRPPKQRDHSAISASDLEEDAARIKAL